MFDDEDEDDEIDEQRHCEQCGAEVTRSEYFDNDDCPDCGRPCSEPF